VKVTQVRLLVVGLVLAVVTAAPAAAHNMLIGSSPDRDAVEAAVPPAVVLTFDQPLIGLGTRVVVTGPTGEVQQGPARLVDNTVTQPLQPGAAAGAYTVAWRVTSVDGHPVSGTYTFTATAAGRGTPFDPDGQAAGGEPAAVDDFGSTKGLVLAIAAAAVVLLLPLGILAWRRRHRKTETGAGGVQP